MALPIDPNQKKDPAKEANAAKTSGSNDTKKSAQSNASKKKAERDERIAHAEAKKKKERNKKFGLIGGGVAAAATVLGISAVVILNYEAPPEENNDDNGGNVSDSGGALSESAGDADYINHGLEIPVSTEDYLSTHRAAVEGGFAEYEESEYDAEFTLPDGSVSGHSGENNPEDGNAEGGEGHSWEQEEINPSDVNWNSSNVRYYIEQTQTDKVQDISIAFPSRAAGFTNNPDHYNLEGGSYNPMYSYVLAEDVEFFFGHHVQRLLNPVYGGWWHAQLGTDNEDRTVNAGEFSDMFTEDYWESNIIEGDVSNLPVHADWEGDNYGGKDLVDDGPRWFGEIANMDNSVSGDVITSVIDVDFTSYNSNGGRVESSGTLELTIVPNPNEGASIDNRLVISEASLTIDD